MRDRERVMTTRYAIHLDGVHASDLSLSVLRDLVDFIVEGTARAARLAAEGRSMARGIAPIWLAEASDVHLVALHEGSLALEVAAPPLGIIAPEAFSANSGDTALDLLLEAVDDALHGRRDSERLDLGMLQTLLKTRTLFGHGRTELRITRANGTLVEISESAVEKFQKLATETPPPRIDRVVGFLDSLTVSTRTCVLKLANGTSLKGYLGPHIDLDHWRPLLGLEIVVEGTVTFRPSGGAQRVDVDHVAPATAHDELWKRSPRGERAREQLPLPIGELTSYFGRWPGDEDDDQVFAALRELS
jgi:hypothetical protein